MEHNINCPCKRKCERHGKCRECRIQHTKENKYLPACERRKKSSIKKRTDTN